MVNKCSVPCCKSGYNDNDNSSISLHRFPQDSDRARLWLRAINRQDFIITQNSRVCSVHFLASDYQETSTDSNPTRKRRKTNEVPSKKILKDTAIPSVFPGQPPYLTVSKPPERPNAPTSSARRAKEDEALQQLEFDMKKEDEVSSLSDFERATLLPSGFEKIQRNSQVVFVYPSEDFSSVIASILIDEHLQVTIFLNGSKVPTSKIRHLLSCDGHIHSLTELCNVLSIVKSWCVEENEIDIIDVLSKQVIEILNKLTEKDFNVEILNFLREQMELLSMESHARRYSSDLLIHAFLWQMTSPSLYKILRKVFILPTVRRLQQLSCGLDVKSNMVDRQYLNERASHLQSYERKVILLIDEVYTADRIEYSNGAYSGLTADGSPAKTVLVFMVQSISSKYRDVVCIIPIQRLTASDLRSYFDRVLVDLKDYFQVCATSVDNHVINR